ncbi:hypothetical protein NIES2135_53650 [Leptolyngbya boryana NIES-2135]|jgi:hypothetical protein|uniref:Uncharacterized protein n=1 Tax=Leptolyngbya boryana NIES-2135 TaxID=1973484 RepID=A0A1Z4JP10_LEPBY|nr:MULTISPECIES: hypothetical protein [Leptolyngbya]BAY58492.1 hypothetical protein NIES2135_53650 [Leptolyngbya boryana NIES-2135]MBD2370967.1 hypothetical protein [Leptolyngbya sp. FACHB-161]MBD2377481.1 hypothetical protein [Leptolyngbya sp. FACHB-238]MBD2401889.1 hypothetical protein [Leptolyngbya sp. FACHB-239]MBD2408407.1 hypothetical protein [Leptolyngbya sp. FACHB-402]
MSNFPDCRFQIGQRVRVSDQGEELSGEIKAILYAETVPSWSEGCAWSRPGFTYFVEFDRPRAIHDIAHESELNEVE